MNIEIISRHPRNTGWVRWVDPADVLRTSDPSGVPGIIDRLDDYIEQGFYAVGFVAYEAGVAFDSHFRVHAEAADPIVPLACFGIFKKFTPCELQPEHAQEGRWSPGLELERYRVIIAEIKNRISRGETYQVNFTFPLVNRDTPIIRSLFERLYRVQPTPYAMLIDTTDFAIASVSPELFFRLDSGEIVCEPMKGTCPRAPHPSMDEGRGLQLRDSVKNRAENLMIVDMVRNDLGRVSEPGSVQVDRLFDVKAWPTLWQMTSTITARTNASMRDIFTALFPSASITGAPKLQTSSIIAELEGQPRGIYTGAIGIAGPGRKATFAVAIRSAVHHKAKQITTYGIGSGIVWDSEADSEYAECLLKSRIISDPTRPSFDLLETMRWDAEHGIILQELHLERMQSSAGYLGFPWPEVDIRRVLGEFESAKHSRNAAMIRLLLDVSGRVRIEDKPLSQPAHYHGPQDAPSITASIDAIRHSVDSPLLYHKTTDRRVYDEARSRYPGVDEVLLVNDQDHVMEFTNGNVVLEHRGQWITPPIHDGLLPGTYRQQLLAEGKLTETSIRASDLKSEDSIYFINSVRGWRRVVLQA